MEKKGTPERQSRQKKRKKVKRICIVRYSYYPQHAHVRRDAETLTKHGYKVDVICLKSKGQKSRETINGVGVYRLPLEHHRRSTLRYIFEFSTLFFLVFWRLSWLSLTRRYQAIEVDSPPEIAVFAAVVPKILGAKVVLFVFDHVPELLVENPKFGPDHRIVKITRWIEKISARWADYTIGTQIFNKQILESHGIPSSRISVVLNVPDEGIFEYSPAPSHDDGTFLIITHGSMLERHGIQTLIRAVPLLIGEIPNLKVNVVGVGEYRPQLEKITESLGITDYVDFTGYVPHKEVPGYIAEAEIGVVAIIDKTNPMLPNKLFDYLAMAKPVVTTSIPAIKAYIDDNSVMYYEPDNEHDLARCILELYRNPEKRAALAAAGSASYQKYRWTTMKYKYLDVYDKLIK